MRNAGSSVHLLMIIAHIYFRESLFVIAHNYFKESLFVRNLLLAYARVVADVQYEGGLLYAMNANRADIKKDLIISRVGFLYSI